MRTQVPLGVTLAHIQGVAEVVFEADEDVREADEDVREALIAAATFQPLALAAATCEFIAIVGKINMNILYEEIFYSQKKSNRTLDSFII